MPQRTFYLAAYDIPHDRRRTAALALIRGYATGGQKSVHEVFLSRGERQELLHTMALLLNEAEDRFFLLRLDPRARTYALGIAAQPADPEYFYVG
jgi:CRISPR-associated protein Cas2